MEQNKIRTYIFYAIGEIALVVIGILIALQVNNWNEERKTEETLQLVLKEVQQDLYNDIVELSLALNWHIEQDSSSTRIIEGRYTRKDFSGLENEHLYQTGLSYYDIIISDRSFQLLSNYKDRIPNEYTDIVKRLNSLYIEDQAYLNRVQDMVIEFTTEYKKNIYTTYEWATPNPDWPSEEWISYFSESTLHKRKLHQYRGDIRGLIGYARRIKDKSVANYMIIRSLLEDDSELPKFVASYGISNKAPLFEYEGLYSFTNENGEIEQIRLTYEYELLFWQNIDDRSMFYFSEILLKEVAPNKLQFAFDSSYNITFSRDSTGKIEKLSTTYRRDFRRDYYLIEQ